MPARAGAARRRCSGSLAGAPGAQLSSTLSAALFSSPVSVLCLLPQSLLRKPFPLSDLPQSFPGRPCRVAETLHGGPCSLPGDRSPGPCLVTGAHAGGSGGAALCRWWSFLLEGSLNVLLSPTPLRGAQALTRARPRGSPKPPFHFFAFVLKDNTGLSEHDRWLQDAVSMSFRRNWSVDSIPRPG